MKFRRFSGANLFSFKSFDLILENRGLLLVTGYSADEGSSNGSGKSSLVNKGLLWTLFGQTAEGLKTDDVINRHLNNEAVGVVVFENAKGDICKIERKRTTSGTSKLNFWINSSDVTLRDMRQTQELINKTLGHDINSFIQTEFFGQGNSTPFMKLPVSEQKFVIEKLLPFDFLNEWLENTKKAKKVLSLRKLELEQEKKSAEAAIAALDTQLKTVIAEQRRWKNSQEDKISNITALFANLDPAQIDAKIKELSDEISYMEEVWKFETFDDSIFKKMEENNALAQANLSLEYQLKCLTDERISLESTLSNKKCYACNQPLSIDEASIKNSLKKCNEKITEITKRKLDNCTLISLNDATIAQFKKVKDKYQNLTAELITQNDLKESLNQRDAKIKEIKQEPNPYLGSIRSLNREIEKYKEGINRTIQLLNLVLTEEEGLNIWEKAFSKDLRLSLYERVCPYLTTRANYHLQKLNNSQISVEFSTDFKTKEGYKAEFSATAWSTSGGGSYSLLSGGEQQMVDFAVGLALSDLAQAQTHASGNILILDEPFVGLDSKNSEAIVSYLTDVLGTVKDTILLVSNEETLKGLIPNRVHVEKKNGISKIVD